MTRIAIRAYSHIEVLRTRQFCSNVSCSGSRVQQYASWDGTLIAMIDVYHQYNLSINTILQSAYYLLGQLSFLIHIYIRRAFGEHDIIANNILLYLCHSLNLLVYVQTFKSRSTIGVVSIKP